MCRHYVGYRQRACHTNSMPFTAYKYPYVVYLQYTPTNLHYAIFHTMAGCMQSIVMFSEWRSCSCWHYFYGTWSIVTSHPASPWVPHRKVAAGKSVTWIILDNQELCTIIANVGNVPAMLFELLFFDNNMKITTTFGK